MPTTDLLPADPARGVSPSVLAECEADADFNGDHDVFRYGMYSALGAARVEMTVRTVRGVLKSGAGREAALATLHGMLLRLERDGHGEYSDTVVRESIGSALALACERAGVAEFTDGEIAEVSLLMSMSGMQALVNNARTTMQASLTATDPTSGHRP